MELRKLKTGEHGDTRFLYENVFTGDSKLFVDYYYTEKTKDNQIFVVEEDGEIRAMIHLNPYTFMVNGREKAVNYIVAVATEEAYRGKGFMKALLHRTIREMYAEGESFTFLMPAAEGIYLPYDFRTVYEQEHRVHQDEQCSDVKITELTAEVCEELASAANAYLAANYQVYALRDEDYYQRLIKEFASDDAGLKVYRKNGVITELREAVPADSYEKKPKIMVRIVDARRMLMSVRLKSLMAVCFQITDPIIEENNRCVVITGTEFSGVMLMDSKVENSEGTLTIGALTSLLFGEKTVEEIMSEDGVSMTERMKGELKKIVPLSKIYINEIV